MSVACVRMCARVCVVVIYRSRLDVATHTDAATHGIATLRLCDAATLRRCGSVALRLCDAVTMSVACVRMCARVRACVVVLCRSRIGVATHDHTDDVATHGVATLQLCDAATLRLCGVATLDL